MRSAFWMVTAGLLASTAVGLADTTPAPAKRPNIVIILADDMGFSDLGCYGSEILTPNLDRLAAGGLRFTQFYNAARCCPSRASLLTGLYPHQAGIGFMVEDGGHPGYLGHLNDRCVTIAEVLRDAGYRTLMAGKWHVGPNRAHWPRDRGFDHYFGLIDGSSSYFAVQAGKRLVLEDDIYTPPDDGSFYMTDAFTDRAIEFIDAAGREDKPFFLYLAYTAPHWPLHAPADVISKYVGKYMGGWDVLSDARYRRMIEQGIINPDWPAPPRDPEVPDWRTLTHEQRRQFDLKMAIYAAQIDRMDENIGRVLDVLKEQGHEENPLIFFLADNGGCAEELDRGKPGAIPGTPESYTSYGRPWAHASNTPFRRFKKWTHEGGIATPLIVSWRAQISKPRVVDDPGHIIDLMATCVEVAGATYPTQRNGKSILPMEGRSLLPIILGRSRQPHPALYCSGNSFPSGARTGGRSTSGSCTTSRRIGPRRTTWRAPSRSACARWPRSGRNGPIASA
jgi:arylsulfatase A-like enzyme